MAGKIEVINNSYGVADQPGMISGSNGVDSLDVRKYVSALEEFVINCPTPMSIALQGDWGTGKTTFLRSMEQDLKDKTTCIYFNTWQYSQFNMSGELYFSFISNIVQKLSHGTSVMKVKDLKNKVLGFLGSMSKQVVKNKVAGYTGLDISELFADEEEKASSIDKLKKDFEDLIQQVATEKNKDRVVIFVDDLDRLDPGIAVELLEVMKLFMDVEKCVYVLAIDYEVVVNGVRAKFGSGMTEEKCRSFFDKIIQLPFRMPVESYNISKLLKNLLPKEKIPEFENKDVLKVIERLIKSTIGPNPRTLKRLVNSFTLLNIVNKSVNGDSEQQKFYHTLLLLSLTIQMYDPNIYADLVDATDGGDEFALREYIEHYDSDENGSDTLGCMKESLEGLAKLNGGNNEDSMNMIYNLLEKAMNLSSITSVSKTVDETVKRSAAGDSFSGMEVEQIEFNGEKIDIPSGRGSQAVAYQESITRILEMALTMKLVTEKEFDERVADLPVLSYNQDEQTGAMRTKKCSKLTGHSDHGEIYIGSSLGVNDKISYIKRVCRAFRISSNILIWYGKDNKGESVSFKIW